MGLYSLRDEAASSVIFMAGSLIWAGSICFQNARDSFKTPATTLNLGESAQVSDDTPLSRPPMPDSWKRLASMLPPRELESASGSYRHDVSTQNSLTRRARGLTWAEQLLIAALICGLIVYVASHWRRIENAVRRGEISPTGFIYGVFILLVIGYGIRRVRYDDQILRDGVMTPGVLTDWYEQSTHSGHSVRIRYQFWTDSGQKFEGSGTLTPGFSEPSLSIAQEPLKVFYLPGSPGKNVALCCTVSRIRLD